jgi:hypothetical protein
MRGNVVRGQRDEEANVVRGNVVRRQRGEEATW